MQKVSQTTLVITSTKSIDKQSVRNYKYIKDLAFGAEKRIAKTRKACIVLKSPKLIRGLQLNLK